MQRFKDKVVWITGASSGIGEALAYEFSREGAKVVLSARREDILSEVRGRCQGGDDRTQVLPVDLSKPETLKSASEQAVGFWGQVDIMIHNGGVGHQDLVEATDLSVDRKVMETNYFGAVTLTKHLLPGMKSRGSGHFVVIGSLSSKFGVPRLSAYAASKHALQGFFESLRAEVYEQGIAVTIVIPGIIRTQITVNALDGSGGAHGKMSPLHEEGMSAEACATKILDAVHGKREEALIGGKEIHTVLVRRLFPGFFSRAIRNHPVKRWRKFKSRLTR